MNARTQITGGVAHPPSDSGRTPTGFDFSTSEKRTFYWTPERWWAEANTSRIVIIHRSTSRPSLVIDVTPLICGGNSDSPAKASLKKGTFQVDLKGGKCKQLVYIGGKTFELLQFHFHNCKPSTTNKLRLLDRSTASPAHLGQYSTSMA